MSTETEKQPTPDDPQAQDAASGEESVDETNPSDVDAGEGAPDVAVPEYQEFDENNPQGQAGDLARIQNIQITVSAELGRATIPIQNLMELSVGSIMELNREIDGPVELVAQGVPLAEGEVVVVNGFFAIRVTKVYENKRG